MKRNGDQMSFLDAFSASEQEQATAHLPSDLERAVPYLRQLIEQFHAAILAGDSAAIRTISDDADELAAKLNGEDGHFGIKGGPDAPCYLLERATAAEPGSVPLWGQTGSFIIVVGEMQVRIKFEGIYGSGFETTIVEHDKPFLSETGYRSFCGAFWGKGGALNLSPDGAVRAVIEHYLLTECTNKKGKLVLKAVKPEYAERYKAA